MPARLPGSTTRGLVEVWGLLWDASVGVGTAVVGTGVKLGVSDGVGLGVVLGFLVGVGLGVRVGVCVAVGEVVGVGVRLGVVVGEAVRVGVCVGVCVVACAAAVPSSEVAGRAVVTTAAGVVMSGRDTSLGRRATNQTPISIPSTTTAMATNSQGTGNCLTAFDAYETTPVFRVLPSTGVSL